MGTREGRSAPFCFFLLFLVVFLETSLGDHCAIRKIHPDSKFVFVHVGKTGGSSISQALKRQALPYHEFHACQPTQKEVEGKPMLISVRHPLSRALSIWNWRKYLCKRRTRCRSDSAERKLFVKCTFTDLVNTMAQSYENGTTISSPCSPKLLGHWNKNHQWYFKNIDESYINTSVWTVDQSSMAQDLDIFFGEHSWSSFGREVILGITKTHINSEYPKDIQELTPTQEEIFGDFLADEIDFYLRLRNKTRYFRE